MCRMRRGTTDTDGICDLVRKNQYVSEKKTREKEYPRVKINHVLISETETGGWPRLLRRRSRVRKNKKWGEKSGRKKGRYIEEFARTAADERSRYSGFF